jgi:hypothetical protein
MTTPLTLARRVVRRHQAAVVFRDVRYTKPRIEYSDGARITAAELMGMLGPTTGPLTTLVFRPSLTGPSTTVVWAAVDTEEKFVSGKLVIHAGISDIAVVTWAEVIVDER